MTTIEALDERLELEDTRMILSYAAKGLSWVELLAIEIMLSDEMTMVEASKLSGINRSRLTMAQTRAIQKLRVRMAELGFNATHQLLSTSR